MNEPATLFCPHCSVEIPSDSRACPHCHAALESATNEAPRRDSMFRYLDNPWIMLALLFFVTAGMGLPFLWKSKAFGPVGKSVLTVIMLAYTAIILWLIYLLIAQMVGQFQELYRTW